MLVINAGTKLSILSCHEKALRLFSLIISFIVVDKFIKVYFMIKPVIEMVLINRFQKEKNGSDIR